VQENYFTSFKTSIAGYDLPERFTFPFYYQPHPLCLLAAEELQQHLTHQTHWQHDFGLSSESSNAIGKMFGVLLVENQQHEIGYVSAFSGKVADSNHLPNFVPPVFDTLAPDGFFMQGQKKLNQLSEQIKKQASNPKIAQLTSILADEIAAAEQAIGQHRTKMVAGRKQRKSLRLEAEKNLSSEDCLDLQQQLAKQSIQDKNQLRDLTLFWKHKQQAAETNLEQVTAELQQLTQERTALSSSLQQQIFQQYQFLNSQGVSKNLGLIFASNPPAAAGECAAPKLLQYAFQVGLKPLALAEFWWGASPKSEIKKHLNFYPACQGKCKPILTHMLEGMSLDENPLLNNPAIGKSLEIVYQDEAMLVINKPEAFLSVPGKTIEDSVYLRIKHAYPEATGPLIVHRLDMSTSGLMLIALSKAVHKHLQKQFIKRSIKKRYVALLEGGLTEDSGSIDLPLRLDIDDRPRQLVCEQYGKSAKTEWQVIQRNAKQTKVYFYPVTGRTHQLRVHAAHSRGLDSPIVGDDLYGTTANRLHLHAEYLEFNHPVTQERMTVQVDAEF